ncbi:MAG TPA: hypothetical protein VH165_23475 [Kofleriaceae bacterium]|jgi:methenyltetrahydromethanopterin cyclohydrolase|nr:hypothetical protein [Kofleriaceae bacterium]
MADSPVIARLRARLAMQIQAPLAVSAGPQQHVFDEESAAYAEIEVRRDDDFAIVIVIGGLPSEQFVVEVWHRHVREVWLVDPSDEAVYVARADELPRRFDRGQTVRSPELPGVAIAVDALFALAS